MADQRDIDIHYTFVDRAWRLGVGQTADYTNALFDGDFSLSLEEAQRRKHEFIYRSLNLRPGSRVLDMGCGWGPLLAFFREKGVEGIGLTLSASQAASCRRLGFEVYLEDCRTVKPERFGLFDAAACVGAMEHFCTKDDWRSGRQERLYRDFFETVAALLPAGGRFYLQTGTLGKNACDPETTDLRAPQDSAQYYGAVMELSFPGSWLPADEGQILGCARPAFTLVSKSNGRLDYVETMGRWRKRLLKFGPKKYLFYASMIPRYMADRAFRERFIPFWTDANKICYEREIFDHFRFVFEKA